MQKLVTLIVLLNLGKKTNNSMAHDSRENVSKEEGSREAKHTAANMAAFSDIESVTLNMVVTKEQVLHLRHTWIPVVSRNCEKSDETPSSQTMKSKTQFLIFWDTRYCSVRYVGGGIKL